MGIEIKEKQNKDLQGDINKEYCQHCGELKGYWCEEEKQWIEITKHRLCNKINKFNNLSILEEKYRKDTFERAETKSNIETNFLTDFQTYCENFQQAKAEGIGIFLTGQAGTGKTFYTHCIINEIEKKGNTVLAFNISKFLSEIKAEGFDEKERAILSAVKEADLIVIDDIGNERLTDWSKERMFNLFNTIYMNRKPLVCSTNLNGEQLKNHFNIQGSTKILDRIMELCKVYKFTWNSRRKEIGETKFEKIWKKEV